MATSSVRRAEMASASEVRRQRYADRDAGIARAVANVLDGSCNAKDAAAGQGVPVGSVRKAVAEARRATALVALRAENSGKDRCR